MKADNSGLSKDNFQRLIEGKLPWEEVKKKLEDLLKFDEEEDNENSDIGR